MALTDLGPYSTLQWYLMQWCPSQLHCSYPRGDAWPWNVMHVLDIEWGRKHETKGRRVGHSDGLGNTELLSHWALAGKQQHTGSVICGVGKNCDAWSEQSCFSETEPTAKTLQNLQLFPESQRSMQLWDCISYKGSDGVHLALQRTWEFSAAQGQVSLFMFLVLPLALPGTH